MGGCPQPHVFTNYILAAPEVTPGRVKVSCGISAYNEGPGVARDVFAVVTILSLPGPNCTAAFEATDANWEGNIAFGVRISLVTKDGYRIAPQSHVQPVVLHFDFAPPFERALKVRILVGSDGGAPYENLWEGSAADTAAVFEKVIHGEIADPCTMRQRPC